MVRKGGPIGPKPQNEQIPGEQEGVTLAPPMTHTDDTGTDKPHWAPVYADASEPQDLASGSAYQVPAEAGAIHCVLP